MVKVLLCGVFILLAAILLSIGGTMLQHLFSVRKKCGLKIIGRSAAFRWNNGAKRNAIIRSLNLK